MQSLRNQIKDRFSIIPNRLIEDPNISAAAKGVYCYLASKPDGWNFFVDEIQKHFTKPIKSAIKELEEHRWLFRQTRAVRGKSKGFEWMWVIASTPFTDGELEKLRTMRDSYYPPIFPNIVNTPAYNKTDLDSNTDLENNTEILTESIATVSDSNRVVAKKGYGEFGKVKLSADEYQKLDAVYGSNLESAIALLDDYLARSNKRYASHYAVMKRNGWVYNEIMKAVPKNEAGDLDLRSW